ncbi:PREDICTED: probable leucine-rich repeat receptor-like serine/threonine-protein kinase At3g14840 [Populus euphratica]|uniref:non-specific serine/threonine protein kinase n=1 Tax=Populus euphratica TaxID=75702 RepID=A0AAJ6T160_POPEU|nr:PREDICTED: probable leucine-rich repeat receptor-like serine/threonine-protein kinase At3g14840 [Populus euphratica]XP_011002768.1 PREDICTED: probable leucine-rich repeat receptor-like serine/threonine-protein kinase At3g14840 [Populus euphratica]XP_011002769.1 PREDICTED: probable leucine-rich repeat receptor-like serine/threonine-protein kinase At3g14840 [Populus euphratica]
MSFSRLLFASLVAFSLAAFASGATRLPDDEVEALRDIAKTIGKTNWNFSADPCGGQWGWVDPNPVKGNENAVSCNCTFSNGTICHVISIVLKTQNLEGSLPRDLGRFPYLQEIDLSRNYLNGTIPAEWGATPLATISIIGNRLTGPIPKEIGNISTLANFTVEFNQLSGVLPPQLGNLTRIEKMHLSSNNFTGQLPETFEKLTTMKDFRIGDNNFTGQIPNLIQKWTNLEKLVIQGSGLSGPIPSGIALLEMMADLRISDLQGNGTEAPFPPLTNMKKLKTLILRSCNIIGPLPDFVGELPKLTTLDLSFNKLIGEIPSSYSGLRKVDYIYLTGNQLNGTVPDWIINDGESVDLSYNNFRNESSCLQRNVNLFGSASMGNVSGSTVPCLRSFHCPKQFYSLHINCGGKGATIEGNIYEDDTDPAGPSRFYQSRTNWAVSTTGHFMDDARSSDSYTWTNATKLSANTSALYMDARLSPTSLTYYGFCMGSGSYTVTLHFAEIMFTDDKTHSSLGRRFFDIYIQGKLVQKDFSIQEEAGGVGKAIIKNFTANVTGNALEIRFYWAGKGTTALPVRGVYGPLISAISVTPDFVPPSENSSSNGTSAGTVVGIVAAVVVVIFLILGILWWKGCLGQKISMRNDLKGLELKTGSFTLRQIKAATNNFDPANKIGEGGFGPVYKGVLSDGTAIAVKQLSSKSKQGNREFVNEIGMISALQHPHLVKLHGCCIEGNQLLLVYEYMENNSLARALFGPEEYQVNLDWATRHKICVGIAKGLAYLHEESRLKIVHRDIKATNVLLDKNLDPKISDFGLAKLDEEENTHISTRVAGTLGYMAPEYAMRGHLTDKADVYSFGIVALEIVSGKSNTSHRTKEDTVYLLDWALVLKEKGTLLELVDPKLGQDYNKEEVMTMINVALLCSNVSAEVRPAMSSVVSMLDGSAVFQDIDIPERSLSTDGKKIEQMRRHFQVINEQEISETRTLSMDGPWTAASTSAGDLYPVSLDSDYWKGRD